MIDWLVDVLWRIDILGAFTVDKTNLVSVFYKHRLYFQILLSEIKLHMLREGQCQRNRIELYDRTTSEDDRTGVYCAGPVQDYRSESNRVYLRILGSRLSEKPVVFGRYTIYKPARTGSSGKLSARQKKRFYIIVSDRQQIIYGYFCI